MERHLIIASPHEERILSWKQGLGDFIPSFLTTDNLKPLLDEIDRAKPEVVLLDLTIIGMKKPSDLAILKTICTKTKVVVLSGDISEDMECELIMTGVRGCCRHDIAADLLAHIVSAVMQGELWVRRNTTSHLLDEIGSVSAKNKIYQTSQDLIKNLSAREFDIALHAANGESNMKISRLCEISERTVETQLSEVFKKLGVSDRINLALMMSTIRPAQKKS